MNAPYSAITAASIINNAADVPDLNLRIRALTSITLDELRAMTVEDLHKWRAALAAAVRAMADELREERRARAVRKVNEVRRALLVDKVIAAVCSIDVSQVALLRRYWTTGKGLARWSSRRNPYSALATELKSDYPTLTPVEVKFLAWNIFQDAFGIRPGRWETRVELEAAAEEDDDGDVTAGGKRRRTLKPRGYRSVEWREEQHRRDAEGLFAKMGEAGKKRHGLPSAYPATTGVNKNGQKVPTQVRPNQVEVRSIRAARHVFLSDSRGGGHSPGLGIDGKTEFPPRWHRPFRIPRRSLAAGLRATRRSQGSGRSLADHDGVSTVR
jgi:hypothetical protein